MFDVGGACVGTAGEGWLMAIAPLPDGELLDALTATRPPLRLLSFPGEGGRAADPVAPVARVRRSRSVSRLARLRRSALVLLLAGLLAGLSVPVSALAGSAPSLRQLSPGATYVVRSGDTLNSIARRLGAVREQHSLVAEMASETGSHTVVVGEHIVLP